MYKVTPGLNLINLHSWNKTVIAKHCWDLEHKQDKLWIKWMHSYFSRSYHFPTSLLDGKEKFGGYSLAEQKYDQATILSRVSAPTESSMEVLDVSKCGSIDKAHKLFHGLKKKDLVAYTAMILGCGINGRANDAIKLFDEMMNAAINPNIVTITGILTAYSHIGMVEEAYRCFISLQKYGLAPSVDHYAIVVDLLSRAGRLEEAHGLIKSMSIQPHAGVWGALLLGCSLHNNLELGEIAATRCIELEPDSSGYLSLLANIYASSGRWDDAERLRKGVEEKGYNKLPGCSWTEEVKA